MAKSSQMVAQKQGKGRATHDPATVSRMSLLCPPGECRSLARQELQAHRRCWKPHSEPIERAYSGVSCVTGHCQGFAPPQLQPVFIRLPGPVLRRHNVKCIKPTGPCFPRIYVFFLKFFSSWPRWAPRRFAPDSLFPCSSLRLHLNQVTLTQREASSSWFSQRTTRTVFCLKANPEL